MRCFKVLMALALVASFATAASAEVQNVKVSGDLTLYSFFRQDYDLDASSAIGNDDESWFQSAVELQVDADLTDNVSTVVRLLNERDWNDTDYGNQSDAGDQYTVNIDLAYVTLKEMLYSPLTLTVGRQDLWLGDGMIIGAKLYDQSDVISADEYTANTGFDAIRATLDYDPWTIDLIYSKIEENGNTGALSNDDVDLYVANVGYIFDSYNAEAEAYVTSVHDRSFMNNDPFPDNKANVTTTYGIRGSFDPVEDGTVKAEVAYQGGDFSANGSNINRSRDALLLDIAGEYNWPDVKWTPKLGIEYIYMSGETDDASSDTGEWGGWNPLFIGRNIMAIRPTQNIFYATAYDGATNVGQYTIGADQDSGLSNMQYLIVSGCIVPTENLTIDAKYAYMLLAGEVSEANENEDVGSEIDVNLTYDYTEDVTFGLLAAWFFPGDYFQDGQDDTAADIVGSMKVSF